MAIKFHTHFPGVDPQARTATHSHGRWGKHTHRLTARAQRLFVAGREVKRHDV